MSKSRQIYLLNPKDLTPETIAVTFAKTSRSPQTFKEIAEGLTDASSSEFHEKWVVGYGHSSVAEHAVLHIAFENISRLAVETLESCRLASFTEKSTRYQKWGLDDFYIPIEIKDGSLQERYSSACTTLIETYLLCLEKVETWLHENAPAKEDEEVPARRRRLRTDAIDACRFLLPSAALANVGMTVNARELEHAIIKSLSHPLEEVKRIGEEMKLVGQHEVPTLVKYAAPSEYLQHLPDLVPENMLENACKDWCILHAYDPQAEAHLCAAALYRFQNIPFSSALQHIQTLSADTRQSMVTSLLADMEKYELPLREAEHIQFTFELVMDQGAYYEFKRHRMMSLTPQALTADLGYCIPKLIERAGMLEKYCNAMDFAGQTWQELSIRYPHAAAYVVPNGFNRRILTSINLRSLMHLVRLRTRPTAHFSIRRVAYQMKDCVCEVLPGIGKYLSVPENETSQSIEETNFFQC